jgi:hypothetical protein
VENEAEGICNISLLKRSFLEFWQQRLYLFGRAKLRRDGNMYLKKDGVKVLLKLAGSG